MIGLNPKLTEGSAGVQDRTDESTSISITHSKDFFLLTQVNKQRMSRTSIRIQFHKSRNFYFVLEVYLAF